MLQSKNVPKLEVVEEDPQTLTMGKINNADAFDLQLRADNAKQELSIVHARLEQERRKNRRLEHQINEYVEALARSTQDCRQVMDQFQLVSNANLACSQELRKAKLIVETLEAVIVLLHTSKDRVANQPIKEQLPVDTGGTL